MNDIYNEFKNNPWNFISRRLKIKIEEKELEYQIKNNQSDLNYRNILLYQNNGKNSTKELIEYEKLKKVKNILIIMYLINLDTYIIEFPKNINYSCTTKITIINSNYSESKKIDLDYYSYGLKDLYYIINKDLKYIYNPITSNIYLEGNLNSKFYFFKKIKTFNCPCSIRIYSVNKILNSKNSWKNKEKQPLILNLINDEKPLYKEIKIKERLIENESFGLNYLINLIENNKFNLIEKTIFKTGIINKDFNKLYNLINNLKFGEIINKNYKIEENLLYKNRYNNYGYIVILKDSFFCLFFNSNSFSPFLKTCDNRQSLFIFMNNYCYYIGKTPFYFNYSFNENKTLIYEFNKSSFIKLKKDKTYTIRGDFRLTCKIPLILNDFTKGTYKDFYLKNTKEIFNSFERF